MSEIVEINGQYFLKKEKGLQQLTDFTMQVDILKSTNDYVWVMITKKGRTKQMPLPRIVYDDCPAFKLYILFYGSYKWMGNKDDFEAVKEFIKM